MNKIVLLGFALAFVFGCSLIKKDSEKKDPEKKADSDRGEELPAQGNPENDPDIDLQREEQFVMTGIDESTAAAAAATKSDGGLIISVGNNLKDRVRVKVCAHPKLKKQESAKDICAIMPERTSLPARSSHYYRLTSDMLSKITHDQNVEERLKSGIGAVLISVTRGEGQYLPCGRGALLPGFIIPADGEKMRTLVIRLNGAPTQKENSYACHADVTTNPLISL